MTQPERDEYDAKLELKYCSILLRRAAVSVGRMIRESWSSIILILTRKSSRFLGWLAQGIRGQANSSDEKLDYAESSVQTVIAATQSDNRDITPTQPSLKPSKKYMHVTELKTDEFRNLEQSFQQMKVDFTTMTVDEFLNFSYLSMFGSREVQIERTVMHGGALFTIHICVNAIIPPGPMEGIRKKS